jgi:hypothetical protein
MLEEIYTHRFVAVEKINGVGPRDPGCYDIAVRYHDGTTFVVEASSDLEDALHVASNIADAFESWMEAVVKTPSITGDPMGDALLASADRLWTSISEDCPYDEVVDHVESLLRGFNQPDDVDSIMQWADIRQCTLTQAFTAFDNQRKLEAAEDVR